MLTFSSPNGSSILISNGDVSVLACTRKEDAGAKADIVLLPNPEETPTDGVISWPGEYDTKGIAIRGIGHDEGRQVSYSIEADGVRIAVLSSPLVEWTDYELELLGEPAVAILPCDDAKIIQKLLEEIDPRVLIPISTDAKNYAEVLKAVGAVGKETLDVFKLKGLPSEGREVVLLGK